MYICVMDMFSYEGYIRPTVMLLRDGNEDMASRAVLMYMGESTLRYMTSSLWQTSGKQTHLTGPVGSSLSWRDSMRSPC